MDPRELSQSIESRRAALAEAITAEHYRRHPALQERYGDRGRAHCLADAEYHLNYLAQAIGFGSEQLFLDYVLWAKVMLAARNVPLDDLAANLETTRDVISREVPGAGEVVARFVASALDALTREPAPGDARPPHADLAEAYLRAVLDGDRRVALQLVNSALDSGLTLRDVYLHMFQATQYEIGRLWQCNEISVADEHLATATTQLVMGQLYPRLFATPRRGLIYVGASVGGELHELGARMVADFFEMEGWTTYYLGANTPVAGIVKTICDRRADVAGISVTISYHVRVAEEMIRAIRGDARCARTKILVGGYPFRLAPNLWQTIGADGYARDAAEATEVADSLIGGA